MSDAKSNRTASEKQLEALAQRYNNLLDQKAETAEDIKQFKAEVTSQGFNMKILDKLVQNERKDDNKKAKEAEEREIADLYAAALGYDSPLFL